MVTLGLSLDYTRILSQFDAKQLHPHNFIHLKAEVDKPNLKKK